jgi:hypothetical protein
MTRIVGVVERKSVVAVPKIGPPILAGVENARAAKPAKTLPKRGKDYKLRVVGKFDRKPLPQQPREIIIGRVEFRPEVAKCELDAGFHGRFVAQASGRRQWRTWLTSTHTEAKWLALRLRLPIR